MRYPGLREYFAAVQNPELVFQTSSLRHARFVVDPILQTPQFASGENAVIFKALVDGEERALRFFIREDVSTRDQYNALGRYFHARNLTDCVATSEWIDDAIRINGQNWPVLQMQWVEGRTLDAYVNHLVESDDTAALTRLAQAWRVLIGRLQTARFAHGDLQHGNVLVDNTGVLRLVDFDASWIVSFSGRSPPSETGHPNYQRPDRPWNEWMDTFPGLLVYTSLLALAKNTAPWRVLYDQTNLLFQRDDLIPPHRTAVWDHIAGIADQRLHHLITLLKQCCAPNWVAEVDLEDLLRGMPTQPSRWWELIESAQPLLPPPPPVKLGALGPETQPLRVPEHPVSRWTDQPPTPHPAKTDGWWTPQIPVPRPGPQLPTQPPTPPGPPDEPATTGLDALLALIVIAGPIIVIIGIANDTGAAVTFGLLTFLGGLIPLISRVARGRR